MLVPMANFFSRGVLRLEADAPRIAVLRALQLGDLLCAIPALRLLRSAFPRAHVSLVGLPWARDFVLRFPDYLDEFIEFPGYPGLPERDPDLRAIPAFLAAMQERRLDLAIQMQGDGTITNTLVALFGAGETAGYRLAAAGSGANVAGHFAVYPSWLPEPQRHLYLVQWITGANGTDALEFRVRDHENAEWAAIAAAEGVHAREYACLHAGARDPRRRWPAEKFARVAARLLARGLGVVLTGNGAEERHLAARIADACPAPVINLVDRTSLGALAAAIRDARVLVTNDTGVSHIAAALRTPSVVVFRVTDPARWAPVDRRRHRVVRDAAGAVNAVLIEAEGLISGEGASAA
jgi:ADP-heptose:LPS heptosyltransferase